MVAREREEEAHGDRVAGHRDDDRRREGEQALGELEAGSEHLDRLVGAGAEDREVEAGREDALAPGQDDDLTVGDRRGPAPR